MKLADEKNTESNKIASLAKKQKFQDISSLKMESLQRPTLFPAGLPPS